ncbi:MAG TPA: adenosylcobalamin-dependent ribonucleoside-diphosphate reductase [candidate division WOR-3 bacterium]|uniref:Vitamin B12-dependent ribonucleotide reductase n=1 Tax=candidate division WOR-3 bacterium TaxID=2052148 RepID=A0A9C9EKJ8_UNCW3|nr:adenosylcobalamin-dependent ribonucleoside-diphosphate reductase [candidate division WOR-3 bacterium]
MEKVIKRDGTVVDFSPEKIYTAIEKALKATGEDPALAKPIGDAVIDELKRRFGLLKPTVEDIQDVVEQELIRHEKHNTAKAYILYRQRRASLRMEKEILGIKDTLKLPLNSLRILEARYLRRDARTGKIESPAEMFQRVAHAVAQADANYGADSRESEERFYGIMANLEFLPNSPTLMNAGTNLGQLSACFVLPIEDSLVSIFETLKNAALIHQSGGGTGFSFSRIRPAGDLVKSTMGVASGPLSFIKIFDRATEIIKQGGMRRGANMAVLSVHHPDIIEFIRAKEQEDELSNFNISVAVTDDFISRAINNQSYELINPRTGKVVKVLNARDVFELIVINAWKSGDPGMIYIDEVNRRHPVAESGLIEATNPCGEVPLLPFEACNLGSINLVKCFSGGNFDYKKLKETVETAIHFLDNVIDVNHYPLPEVEKITKANRKIGLGVMGFADCLIKMNIPYNSQEALNFAEELMSFIQNAAREASTVLGEKRGSFPNIDKSVFKNKGPMRNATVTSIAPTGSISTIADVSSGIEPLFSVGYLRHALDTTLLVINPMFEEIARKKGVYSTELMSRIVREGSIQKNSDIPEELRRLFPTAHDITPDFHIRMQAVFQKYVDNAVSKTINLPYDATLEHTRSVFLLAHKLKCKGITIYRYGSKKRQALEHSAGDYRTGCAAGVCDY